MKNKIPLKLLWSLLYKIFEDLDINKLQLSFFENLEVKPNNSYELLYGLILKLFDGTLLLYRSATSGVSTDITGMDIDKTIAFNTLYDCAAYSTKYEYRWECAEHNAFLKALSICKENSSPTFTNQKCIKDYIKYLMDVKDIRTFDCSITVDSALAIINKSFDASTNSFKDKEDVMNRASFIYISLCQLSYLVLKSQSQETNISGFSNINYSRLDYYIVQQYGVREVWNVINRQASLKGKKHREFQSKILVSSNCSALEPDALYIFDDNKHRDIILDVKLYGVSCLDANKRHRFSNNTNQVCTYKYMYPQYIASHKNKDSRKNITPDGVDAWLLYFRRDMSNDEKQFNGTRLDVGNIGVFTVNMFQDCTIDNLDEQIKEFVLKYLL